MNFSRIVAVGAHPDDIEPQIGGTLLKYAALGSEVTLVNCTDTGTAASSSRQRQIEAESAAKNLGVDYHNLNIPQSDFAFNRMNIQYVESIITKLQPTFVFTMSRDDSHNDHQTINSIIKSVGRKNTFSIASLGQALPGGINTSKLNMFIDISEQFETKINSINCYTSQIEKFGENWLEAIENRDKYYGFQIGVRYAEAAKIEKCILI